jgi:indolepyruvate ferredoxin oxidoreductase, alpha subunit
MQKVLTGNQAIARGFYESGGILAASYPGSPTVEILESLKEYNEIYSEFSTNEKVALEVAMGASFAGARTMCSMKHVGLNIAADPLMTFTQTVINGGFLLVSGDDPGLASSQNEQDNRIFGKFANMAILDPSTSNEAKEYTKKGLEISEEYQIPTMLRITSRLCHSRGVVELEDREKLNIKEFKSDISKYCMLPPHANKAQYFMKERLERLEEYAYNSDLNILYEVKNSDTLIITSGLVYQHLKEINPNVSIYKLGLIYPISIKKISELSQKYKNLIVLEEMTPFIENELKTNKIDCKGKEYFSFTGELQIEDIENGLIKAGITNEEHKISKDIAPIDTVPRSPMFCSGCPHRPVFDILKKSKAFVIGDIGCYSMALLYPFEVSQINISMGSSLGIIKGMRKTYSKLNDNRPLVCVIGDGTFFHSGLPGAVNLIHQLDSNENMTVIILDNGTTAMTGGQPNGSSGVNTKHGDMNINIEQLLKILGFEDITRIDQFEYSNSKKIVNDAIKRNGLSFIITSRPCALGFKVKEPYFYVDPSICIGCRSCVKTNCPPIKMKKYEGIEKLKSSIDSNMCVGCSVCAQVCPVGAIKRSGETK